MTAKWSTHSRRIDPISRSAKPFCQGEAAAMGRSDQAIGKLNHQPTRGMIVAAEKSTSPTWMNVKASLLIFDRAGLLGPLQHLYATSKPNQAFLHARLGLGSDQLGPYKAIISRWINPDLMRDQRVSISKAKQAIADYKRAIGRPEGLAELSIFFCEEAFSLVESCSFDDERYFCCADPNV